MMNSSFVAEDEKLNRFRVKHGFKQIKAREPTLTELADITSNKIGFDVIVRLLADNPEVHEVIDDEETKRQATIEAARREVEEELARVRREVESAREVQLQKTRDQRNRELTAKQKRSEFWTEKQLRAREMKEVDRERIEQRKLERSKQREARLSKFADSRNSSQAIKDWLRDQNLDKPFAAAMKGQKLESLTEIAKSRTFQKLFHAGKLNRLQQRRLIWAIDETFGRTEELETLTVASGKWSDFSKPTENPFAQMKRTEQLDAVLVLEPHNSAEARRGVSIVVDDLIATQHLPSDPFIACDPLKNPDPIVQSNALHAFHKVAFKASGLIIVGPAAVANDMWTAYQTMVFLDIGKPVYVYMLHNTVEEGQDELSTIQMQEIKSLSDFGSIALNKAAAGHSGRSNKAEAQAEVDLDCTMLRAAGVYSHDSEEAFEAALCQARSDLLNLFAEFLEEKANLADALLEACVEGHGGDAMRLAHKLSKVQLNAKNSAGDAAVHIAARKGMNDVLGELIDSGANFELQDASGHTALLVAAANGNAGGVQLLIRHGASTNKINIREQTALHLAVASGNCDAVRAVLDAIVHPNEADKQGNTALHLAVARGDAAVVKLLLERGARADTLNNSNQTAVHLAFEKGNDEVIKELLDAHTFFNVQDGSKRTALHYAVEKGNLQYVRRLLEHGAKPDVLDANDQTPLAIAMLNGRDDLVAAMLEESFDTNLHITRDGRTALHIAIQQKKLDFVRQLVALGAAAHVTDANGESALILAFRSDPEYFDALLASAPDVNVPSLTGETILHLAAQQGRADLAATLLRAGANPDVFDLARNTPLHSALAAGSVETLKAILKANPEEIDSLNMDGVAPIHLAAQRDSPEAVEVLMQHEADCTLEDGLGHTILHTVCAKGWVGVLRNGHWADVNSPDTNGDTPLMVVLKSNAADDVKAEEFRILVKLGADINAVTSQGETVLALASRDPHLATYAAELIEFGDDAMVISEGHPLWQAFETNNDVLIRAVLERKKAFVVELNTGARMVMAADPNLLVKDIKENLENSTGIKPNHQRLLVGETEVKAFSSDGEKVANKAADFGIVPGARISVKSIYSSHMGQTGASENVELDQHGNALGSQFDLGVDGAFDGLQVVVIQLYSFDFTNPTNAMKSKGFKVKVYTSAPPPDELDQELSRSCQLWIISTTSTKMTSAHVAVVKKYFDNGLGIYIFGDNDPFFADANLFGAALLNATMFGDVPGGQTVSHQTNDTGAGFTDHLLMTSIKSIFEGSTVATVQHSGNLEPVIYGSAGNLVTAAYDQGGRRAVFDGAFTRLFVNWDGPGTERYVINSACWLANVERHW
eukprot:c20537_g1_i3.p1 GENE.c20537_g1_i3~~c20537_g1_i3.p1  ORF type:complete len:1453 (-),score=405.95 c20537_g1_i3:200-4219(-)